MFVEHKEAGEVTEQPAKVLKLSEAMRIGARQTLQCFKVYTDGLSTCAIGAAYLGLGGDPRRLMNTTQSGWQYTPTACMFTPEHALSKVGVKIPRAVANDIVMMNDMGKTREEIADWLERHGL